MKYHLITMGCPKNRVDSDGIEMLLRQADYREAGAPGDADILIVNTCGFLESAKEESIDVLNGLARHKRKHQLLIAAGCLAQRNGAEVLARVPKVDGLLGTRRWMDVLELLDQVRGGKEQRRLQRYALLGDSQGTPAIRVPALLDDPSIAFDAATPRPPVPAGSAYLKISDGCNAPCAFCTIPSFKGKLRSRPMDAIVDEAQALVGAGAKELVIVAQDTTDYGNDWGEPNSLAQLLSALASRTDERLKWIRLMYAYPGHVTDELIEVMAREAKIVPYLDMPLQHGDPGTLRRMRRPSRVEMVYEHMAKLRTAMPEIALRTTFIVGYPGETEKEFEGLLDFVKAIEFDKVGAFTFSPEPGTPSAELPDQIADEVKQERYERLMEVQQPISLRKNQLQVGKILDVLVEGEGEVEGSGEPLLLGRSYRDAPEIDGLVLLPGVKGAPIGTMIPVHINGAMEYDLVGELLVGETIKSRKGEEIRLV
ncbi:MAG: 30S ribosomal protein S12 methylthiotransferase RimO [Anaerolineales bacterium]|nr:30S ribosomal protein S12 methylthiotransferase RimO [Anaerolineales bacterium]